jgi:hypothetical protein
MEAKTHIDNCGTSAEAWQLAARLSKFMEAKGIKGPMVGATRAADGSYNVVLYGVA